MKQQLLIVLLPGYRQTAEQFLRNEPFKRHTSTLRMWQSVLSDICYDYVHREQGVSTEARCQTWDMTKTTETEHSSEELLKLFW